MQRLLERKMFSSSQINAHYHRDQGWPWWLNEFVSASLGGVLGMSNQTEEKLERLCVSAGLGFPRWSWWKRLGFLPEAATLANWSQIGGWKKDRWKSVLSFVCLLSALSYFRCVSLQSPSRPAQMCPNGEPIKGPCTWPGPLPWSQAW